MKWVLIIAATWVALGVPLALLIGRGVRIADAEEARRVALDGANFVVDDDRLDGSSSGTGGETDWLEKLLQEESQNPLHPPTDRDRPTIPGLPVARPSPRPPPGRDPWSSKPQQPPPIRKSQEG
jgi:hypothetical protein